MVIPVHDVNPTRRTAWVTYALITANVVVFLKTPGMAGSVAGDSAASQLCHLQAFLERWAAVPQELIQGRTPDRVPTGEIGVGPAGPGCVIGPAAYHKVPPLSVLTSMFLHGSWLHLLGNVLFLWIFGDNVEDRLGHLRYLLFYLMCGYAAAYGFALADPASQQPLIGASGAIAGVLGAYLVLYPTARVWVLIPFLLFLPLRLPAWVVLCLWFALQAVFSYGGGVDRRDGGLPGPCDRLRGRPAAGPAPPPRYPATAPTPAPGVGRARTATVVRGRWWRVWQVEGVVFCAVTG